MSKEKNIEKVKKAAETEVGYHEKNSKKDLDSKTKNAGNKNYTKYAEWFDTKAQDFYNTKKNPTTGGWCDVFVDWLFCQVFGEKTAREMLYQPKKSLGAGCKYSAGYYRSNKAWHAEGQVGDQIFYGTKGAETHTGWVAGVTEKSYITIEGNADNEVKKKTVSKTSKKIAGFGRPNWAAADKTEEKPKEDKPKETPTTAPVTAPKPSNGKTIKASQKASQTASKYAREYTVTAEHGLNIRDKAGKDDAHKVLAVAKYGSKVTCGGSYNTVSGETWLLVKYEKAGTTYEGYCCNKYLR